MKLIDRTGYLQKLINVIGTPDITKEQCFKIKSKYQANNIFSGYNEVTISIGVEMIE